MEVSLQQVQQKNDLPTTSMDLLGGHCFVIDGSVKAVGRYLRKTRS